MTIATVSANEARALITRGARLIDIRAADEYAREHIPAATLLPLEQLTHGAALNAQPGDTIIFTAVLARARKITPVFWPPPPRPRRLSCWLAVFRRGGRRGCR